MSDNFDLPALFREQAAIAYSAEQLAPTLARLRQAASDVTADPVTAPALAAAWTRLAELRLPRKAVPPAALSEIEDLVIQWGSHSINGSGGISACAYALSEIERGRAAARIRMMLAQTEAAASAAPPTPSYRSE